MIPETDPQKWGSFLLVDPIDIFSVLVYYSCRGGKVKKIIGMLVVLVTLSACAPSSGLRVNEGIETYNGQYEITLLFEYKGVQIYRFQDGGKSRYFSIGKGEFLPQVQSTGGKNPTTWSDGAERK